MKVYTIDDLLEAREKRVDLIETLLKQYNTPLLVMRVNYPGLEKTNKMTINIIEDMNSLICTILSGKVCGKLLLQGAEGPILYVVVNEDVLVLKRIAINLEEKHPLGRCLDLDVYDLIGKSIAREELGYPRRKCYLCEDYAHCCVRAKRHSEQAVIAYIKEKYRSYSEETYGMED